MGVTMGLLKIGVMQNDTSNILKEALLSMPVKAFS
jgi:hypothetical protein